SSDVCSSDLTGLNRARTANFLHDLGTVQPRCVDVNRIRRKQSQLVYVYRRSWKVQDFPARETIRNLCACGFHRRTDLGNLDGFGRVSKRQLNGQRASRVELNSEAAICRLEALRADAKLIGPYLDDRKRENALPRTGGAVRGARAGVSDGYSRIRYIGARGILHRSDHRASG